MMTFFKRYGGDSPFNCTSIFNHIVFRCSSAQETKDEQAAASQELAAFAGSHDIDYWSCEPSSKDGTWTAELGVVAAKMMHLFCGTKRVTPG